jgi:hypothetical protein
VDFGFRNDDIFTTFILKKIVISKFKNKRNQGLIALIPLFRHTYI